MACCCGAILSSGWDTTGCVQARVGEVLSLLGHHDISLTFTSQRPANTKKHTNLGPCFPTVCLGLLAIPLSAAIESPSISRWR